MISRKLSKDEYYMNIAREVSRKSTCFRRVIGAIIIRDDQIISTGYAGAPRKTKDSLEHGFCLRDKLKIPHGQRYELCRSVHAEQNAIINAARAGVSLLGGNMYLYGSIPGKDGPIDALPCFICKKMIINAGLDLMICSTKEGNIVTFKVSDWADDWQKNDIIDDKQQYG
jgi:dCMP deaminase